MFGIYFSLLALYHRAYSVKLAESSRGLAGGMVEGIFFDRKT
jgi:hypothetical protein